VLLLFGEDHDIFNRLGLALSLAYPGVGSVPHDGQHPGARVIPGEPADSAKGAQACLLHDVFGVRSAACQRVGERIGIAEMRGHELSKARVVITAD
jgi:hypothetical protein